MSGHREIVVWPDVFGLVSQFGEPGQVFHQAFGIAGDVEDLLHAVGGDAGYGLL